ncbi:MAG: hypothetical protein K8E24_001075 [Methanobacterium paludis]|nr:hypothetical protein [Methanobacterium paludis]
MNKTVIILALMLVLGIVVISGCTTTPSNTSGMGQNSSPNTTGYSTGQIVSIDSGNSEINGGSNYGSGH